MDQYRGVACKSHPLEFVKNEIRIRGEKLAMDGRIIRTEEGF